MIWPIRVFYSFFGIKKPAYQVFRQFLNCVSVADRFSQYECFRCESLHKDFSGLLFNRETEPSKRVFIKSLVVLRKRFDGEFQST